MQSLFLLVEIAAQAEERERKGTRMSKVVKVVGDAKVVAKVVKVKVVGIKVIETGEGASEEEEGVSRSRKKFCDDRGSYVRQRSLIKAKRQIQFYRTQVSGVRSLKLWVRMSLTPYETLLRLNLCDAG